MNVPSMIPTGTLPEPAMPTTTSSGGTTRRKSLFEIERDLFAVMTAFEDTLAGAETEEDRFEISEGMKDLIGEVVAAEQESIDSFGRSVKHIKAEIDFLKAEEKQVAARRRAIENRLERLRESIKDALVLHGKQKVKGHVHTIYTTVRTNLELTKPASELPEEYREQVVTFEPRKDEIKAALAEGVVIDGAVMKEKTSVTIR